MFETLGAGHTTQVRATGEVIGRVVDTFARTAASVIDVTIVHADAAVDTLTGTPNHPFWGS